MKNLSAHDAKARFGQLLDAAQQAPVTISKHGREVAVMMSKQEFDALQALKLEHLRAEVRKGLADLRGGRFEELAVADAETLGHTVKAARKRKGG
jgi:prevent-host-death family protein